MKSAAMCRRETNRRSNRGSTLAAALALVFLIFAVTMVSLTRVACSWAEVSQRHRQAAALFLAEAGLRKAGQSLAKDKNYTGETGTRLETGTFSVKVSPVADGSYIVTSMGYADAAVKVGRKRTVQATVRVTGPGKFTVGQWRENP